MTKKPNQQRSTQHIQKTQRALKTVSTLVLAGFGLLMMYQASPRYKAQHPAATPTTAMPIAENPGTVATATSAPGAQAAPSPTDLALADNLKTLAQSEFAAQLAELQKSLPTKKSLRQLPPAELHGTPQAVLQAGLRLGAIKEQWQKAPHLRPQALQFYQQCFLALDLELSVASLCLSQARALSRAAGQGLDEAGVSAEVKALANQIP